MSYLYKAHCYETTAELHAVVAGDCFYTNGQKIVQCSPTLTGIDMNIYDIATQTTQTLSIVPAQIECAPVLTDVIDLSWKIALVLIAGWAVRQLYFAIKTS